MVSKVTGYVWTLFLVVALLFAVGANATAQGLASLGIESPFKALGAFINSADQIGPALNEGRDGGGGSDDEGGAASDSQDA